MYTVGKSTRYYSGFSPTSIPGCSLWLDAAQDANTDGAFINTLPDRSLSNYTINAVTSNTVQLSKPGLNGLPIYNFGSNRMVVSNFVWRTRFTSFFVTQANLGRFLFSQHSGAGYRNYTYGNNSSLMFVNNVLELRDSVNAVGVPVTGTDWNLFTIGYVNGTTIASPYNINGTARSTIVVSGSARTDTTDTMNLWINGNSTTTVDNTKVAEILFYNDALTTPQVRQIEGYLARKWGLTTNLPASHPYRSLPPFLRQFSPLDIPGCQLWLDAADSTTIDLSGGSNVSQWNDKSGLGNNAIQLTAGNRPTYNSINRNIVFTRSSSNFLNLPNNTLPTGNNSYGYFIVCSWAQAISGMGIIGGGNYGSTSQVFALRTEGTNRQIMTYWWANDLTTGNFAYTVDVPLLVEATYTSGGARAILTNGTQLVRNTPSARNQGSSNNTIGTVNTTSYHDGTISEILVYNAALTDIQRQQVEGYLADKWGLRNELTPLTITPSFTPASISGLRVWLDAADATTVDLSGSEITQLRDKSSNAYVFSNASGFSYNVTKFQDIYPSFYRASSSNGPSLGSNVSATLTQPITFFAVAVVVGTPSLNIFLFDTTSSNAAQRLVVNSGSNTANPQMFAGGQLNATITDAYFTPLIHGGIFNGSSSSMFLNGTTNVTGNAGTNPTVGLIIGTRLNRIQSWAGHICELVIYDGALEATQRRQIETYLANKWGLQRNLPTHPFKFSRALTVPFNPVQVSGCALWLDAADSSTLTLSGSNVTQWGDKSGNGRNASQATSSNRPTYTTNFVNFNGTTHFLTLSNITSFPSNESWFVVFRFTGTGTNRGWNILGSAAATGGRGLQVYRVTTDYNFGPDKWGSGTIAFTPILQNTSYIGEFTYSGGPTNGVFNVYTNGTITSGSPQTVSFSGSGGTNIGVGSTSSFFWQGSISEVLYYTSALTNSQRQQVEGYLAWKWGLQRNLPTTHPYYKFNPS